MFIMIDGIDGSGKSTVVQGWKDYLNSQGNTIFDLKEYWQKEGCYPPYSELRSYDFIISGEPTYVGVGKAIREHLIRTLFLGFI
jgi:thymidylate kinase